MKLNCKFCVSTFCLLIITMATLYAVDSLDCNNSSFEINLSAAGSYSELNEYVYEKKIKESEINWDGFSPAVKAGLGYSINNFDFGFSVYSAIPVESGTVRDKDFFVTGSETGKTARYSEHDRITDKDYSFDLEAWYSVPVRRIRLSAGISGVYSNFKAETDDGFLQYPKNENDVWTGTEKKEILNGTAITYEQQRMLAGIGFMVSSNPKATKNLDYFVKGIWYPFARIDAIDNHYLRLVQFCDSLHDNAQGFSVSAGISYSFTDSFAINFTASYKYLEADGNTRTSPIGVIAYNTTEAKGDTTVGTSLREFQAGVGSICRF